MVNQEQIDKWKQEHGEVYKITGEIPLDDNNDPEPQDFYFSKPGRIHLSRFAKEAIIDALKAQNNVVFGCLLHPAPETVQQLVAKKPGLIIPLASELLKVTGLNQDFLAKKL